MACIIFLLDGTELKVSPSQENVWSGGIRVWEEILVKKGKIWNSDLRGCTVTINGKAMGKPEKWWERDVDVWEGQGMETSKGWMSYLCKCWNHWEWRKQGGNKDSGSLSMSVSNDWEKSRWPFWGRTAGTIIWGLRLEDSGTFWKGKMFWKGNLGVHELREKSNLHLGRLARRRGAALA